jgi:hypothetical protein
MNRPPLHVTVGVARPTLEAGSPTQAHLKPGGPTAFNPVLLWVSGGACLLFVCCLFLLFILMTRTEPLVQRLTREARAFEGDEWPRPSHFTPPVPGRFSEALTPLLPELEALPVLEPHPLASPHGEAESDEEAEAYSEAYDALEQQCLSVSRGEAPLGTAPWECLELLRENRELVHRVLATTRAETGGLPESLGSLARPGDTEEPLGLNLLERVVELAALETQVLIAGGRPLEAVDTCMDGLALSRELSLGAGMYGLELSALGHDTLYLPCAAALDTAPVERLHEAREQLSRLRQGYPPLSAVLREESVYQQLSTYGDLLPPPAIDALPPAGQELATAYDSYYYYAPTPYPRLRPYVWRRNAALFEAMVAVADLPAEQRRKAFSSIDARQGAVPEDLAWHAQDYSELAERLEPQRLQALALAALVEVKLARAERGSWPEALPSPLEGSFILVADTELEAWLVPVNEALGVRELRLTAQPPPVPRARYAGGVLR